MEDTIPVESVSRLDIQPGETLVVRMHCTLSAQEAQQVKDRMLPHLPDGVRLLVLGSGIELTKLAAGDLPAA